MHELLEKYIISKIDGSVYCICNGQFTKHIRKYNFTFQDYYEHFYTKKKEICRYCSENFCKLLRSTLVYTPTCGSNVCYGKHMSKEIHGTRTREQIKISNEKRKITNLQKYGQISSIPKEQKEKIIEKMIREGRYADIAKKGKQSKKIKYGNENYNNAIQIKKSKASRTSLQEKESSEKRRRTCLELYGIENILMRDDIKHKIGQFNGLSKKYMLPSGAEIQVAGYEQLALDILFKTYNEDECISGVFFGENKRIGYNIPVIKYKDTKNRSRRYYPDIYLPNENKIIEVKSRWWYDGCGKEKYKSRLENNNKKRNATLKEGYDFEIWIMDNNGLKEIIK